MRPYRMGKGTTECYSSFKEAAAAWGCKPVEKKRPKDETKLTAVREKFVSNYKCKACGEPMTYIGGSMMCCKNEKCKGIKVEEKDKEGNIIKITYEPSFKFVKEEYIEMASNIFDV